MLQRADGEVKRTNHHAHTITENKSNTLRLLRLIMDCMYTWKKKPVCYIYSNSFQVVHVRWLHTIKSNPLIFFSVSLYKQCCIHCKFKQGKIPNDHSFFFFLKRTHSFFYKDFEQSKVFIYSNTKFTIYIYCTVFRCSTFSQLLLTIIDVCLNHDTSMDIFTIIWLAIRQRSLSFGEVQDTVV